MDKVQNKPNSSVTNVIYIKGRKWRWIGHTLRKPTDSIETSALGWNSQGARRRGYTKKHGRGRSRKKPWNCGRHGARLKELLLTGSRGSVSQCPMLQGKQQELTTNYEL
jgi:hypothetical protein